MHSQRQAKDQKKKKRTTGIQVQIFVRGEQNNISKKALFEAVFWCPSNIHKIQCIFHSGKNAWKAGLLSLTVMGAFMGGNLLFAWGRPLYDKDGEPISKTDKTNFSEYFVVL